LTKKEENVIINEKKKAKGVRTVKIAGIVCECNPFHKGHQYLIDKARENGADAVICVMSGCFTQRGEAAIIPPQTRGEMVIHGGADAVFELPFPHSSSGAERFAEAGVLMLSGLGATELWFGSECGSLDALNEAAEITLRPDFGEAYQKACTDSPEGTASLYFDLLRSFGAHKVPFGSNDALGIAYIRAIRKHGLSMAARTVCRQGDGYLQSEITDQSYPSASALRKRLFEEGVQALNPYFAPQMFTLIREQIAAGHTPASLERAERAILAHFRLANSEALENVPELGGGLGRRIAQIAREATSLSDLIGRSATKKYTESRIRRGILFAMTGITKADVQTPPAYAVLLAANEKGCEVLAHTKKTRTIPVVTSHAGIPETDAARRQHVVTERAFALYTLCTKIPISADAFLRASSRIIK
jgi:predicted nucleotidyltransferase